MEPSNELLHVEHEADLPSLDFSELEHRVASFCGVDFAAPGTSDQTVITRVTPPIGPYHAQLQSEAARSICEIFDRCWKLIQAKRPNSGIRFHVARFNRSRSHARNSELGRHAERQAARWPEQNRRYKKWARVASKCGTMLFGNFVVSAPNMRRVTLVDMAYVVTDGKINFYSAAEAPTRTGRIE